MPKTDYVKLAKNYIETSKSELETIPPDTPKGFATVKENLKLLEIFAPSTRGRRKIEDKIEEQKKKGDAAAAAAAEEVLKKVDEMIETLNEKIENQKPPPPPTSPDLERQPSSSSMELPEYAAQRGDPSIYGGRRKSKRRKSKRRKSKRRKSKRRKSKRRKSRRRH